MFKNKSYHTALLHRHQSHTTFSGSPEAMRFASDQHKIGYGDESWATTSMLRIQSQKQQPTVQGESGLNERRTISTLTVRLGHLPQPQHEAEFNIPRTTSESPYSHPPQSPPSHEHGSPLPPPPAPQQQQQQYNHYGSYRRSAKPTFSTFVDNQSETSSMSAALINGHMSPDFDRLPSSANNTLERRAGYSWVVSSFDQMNIPLSGTTVNLAHQPYPKTDNQTSGLPNLLYDSILWRPTRIHFVIYLT